MHNIRIVCRRELAAYFTSPLAYVFIVIFLALSGGLTFYVGNFLDGGRADLDPFFQFHAWLYLLLIPALGMRLWAEERKTGTIEMLMTLPLSTADAVIGKFFAAWIFAGIALVLTFPIWITVNYLGNPDNGAVAAAYLGSWLMAGGFLAISACISALTSNQVVAFVLAATVCFLFVMSGVEFVQALFAGWAPSLVIETLSGLSFLNNFNAIAQGVLDVRHVVFFVSLIGVCLFINVALVDVKKGA